jgi:uncharacterized repeat protein (TIGR01451 family)
LNWADGDSASKSFNVPILEDNIFEGNELFNVALNTPVGALLGTAAGSVTIADNDAAPTISIVDGNGSEPVGPATLNVVLSNPTTQTVTVDFSSAGVSAISGTDFQPVSGTLTFNPLVTSQPINVTILDDALDEPNETFTITLTNPNNAAILDGSGTGTIIDNDGPPALTISDVALPEGNVGTTNFQFTVTLSPSSGQQVTVDYTTQNVSAAAGSDYTTTAGTLTFVPGDTSETINVPVSGDVTVEPNETFTVVLSNAPLAILAGSSGTGTIQNDDVAPVADLGVTKAIQGTGPYLVGQNATFTITVSNAGPSTATNVHVIDTLPAGTSFVSATPSSGSCSGTVTVDCNVGTLLSGGSANVTLTVLLTQPGNVTNTATANSDAVDPNGASGSASFAVAAPASGDPIPTLSEWMLLALASALAAIAATKIKR